MKFLNLLLFIVASSPLTAQQFTHYTESDGLVNNSVNCLSIDDNQSVWFGTNRGLAMFNGEVWMSDTTHLINNLADLEARLNSVARNDQSAHTGKPNRRLSRPGRVAASSQSANLQLPG